MYDVDSTIPIGEGLVIRILAFSLCCVLAFGCANPSPPSGGPRDTVPPEIQSSLAARTLNMQESEVSFTFSEWVDRESFAKAFSITPSLATEISWSGKEVVVEFQDSLQPETTYVLDISPSLRDLRGNKLHSSYSLPFSTGSIIDSMYVSGHVVSEFANTKVFLYDARIDLASLDSIVPEYKQTVNRDGTFTFQALKNKPYTIVVVDDVYGDNYTTPVVDAATLGEKVEVMPSESLSIAGEHWFWLQAAPDTIAAKVRGLSSTSQQVLRISLSESVQWEEAAVVCSQLDGAEYADTRLYINADSSELYVFSEKWRSDDRVVVQISSLKDVANNVTVSAIRDTITISKEATTLSLQLPRTQRSPHRISILNPLVLSFSAPISQPLLSEMLWLMNVDSTRVEVQLLPLRPNLYQVRPVDALDYTGIYTLSLDWSKYKGVCETPDTVHTQKLTFVDPRDLGTIRLAIQDQQGNDRSAYIAMFVDNKGVVAHSADLKGNGDHTLEYVPTGTFTIRVVRDVNNNGKYDQGSVVNGTPAEAFRQTQQPVTIKERWVTEGITIEF